MRRARLLAPVQAGQRTAVNRDLAQVALALALENIAVAAAGLAAIGVTLAVAVAAVTAEALAAIAAMARAMVAAVDRNRVRDCPYVALDYWACYFLHSAFQKGAVASYYSYVHILFFTQWNAPLAFAYPLVKFCYSLNILDCSVFVCSDEKKR